MAVIVLASPKGGAGKSTAATILGTELALRGASVTLIDADPNKNLLDWARLGGGPANLAVVGEVGEDSILDTIEDASSKSSFVVIDLEGTASVMVSYAISMADLVLIPVQGSQMDAKQAARQIKLIKAQERIVGRPIPFAVVLTRTNPAIIPKTLRHIEESFVEHQVPVLATRLSDREAFRALFSYGGTIQGLEDKGVSNLAAALLNARAFTAEVIDLLRRHKSAPEKPASTGEVA